MQRRGDGVGDLLALFDINAAAHINPAEDVRATSAMARHPRRDAGDTGAAARQRHDTEPRRDRRRRAQAGSSR
jgi:hypothetical protein